MNRATVRRWYGDPALVEAIFEIKPEHTGDMRRARLDAPAMEQMAARLRGFDHRTERLELHAPTSRYGLPPSQHQTSDGADSYRTCLWNEEQSRCVQFGGGLCAFNVLTPYGHYEDHVPLLRRVFQTYLEAAALDAGVRCAHRYLNVFGLKPFERPDELFSFYPPLPQALIQKHVAVSLRIEAVSFRGGVCTVRLWRHAVDELEVCYRMEVEAQSTASVKPSTEAILQWHQIAHDAVNQAFDMSITPACRKRLREL